MNYSENLSYDDFLVFLSENPSICFHQAGLKVARLGTDSLFHAVDADCDDAFSYEKEVADKYPVIGKIAVEYDHNDHWLA